MTGDAPDDQVLISDPKAIKALYGEPAHGLPRKRGNVLEPVFGPRSISLLEGDEHAVRRRLMLSLFSGHRMRESESEMERVVADEIDSWPLGEELALHPRMEAITQEMILRVVFGVADGSGVARLRAALGELLAEITSPSFTEALNGGAGREREDDERWARLEAQRATVDELLRVEIAERRAAGDLEQRGDSLSALLLARFEDGEAMSDDELCDQLVTLLVAGYETTAAALAWTFELLLCDPRVLDRLRESLGSGDGDYLRATVAEALRLRPVVPLTGRRLGKELDVEGRTLAAGTDVMSAILLTHTRSDVYGDPFEFRPERFLEGGPDPFAWIPFGGGNRRCLGGSFAELEMRLVVREVIARCGLRKVDPTPERVERRFITLAPARGVRVVVTDRRLRA